MLTDHAVLGEDACYSTAPPPLTPPPPGGRAPSLAPSNSSWPNQHHSSGVEDAAAPTEGTSAAPVSPTDNVTPPAAIRRCPRSSDADPPRMMQLTLREMNLRAKADSLQNQKWDALLRVEHLEQRMHDQNRHMACLAATVQRLKAEKHALAGQLSRAQAMAAARAAEVERLDDVVASLGASLAQAQAREERLVADNALLNDATNALRAECLLLGRRLTDIGATNYSNTSSQASSTAVTRELLHLIPTPSVGACKSLCNVLEEDSDLQKDVGGGGNSSNTMNDGQQLWHKLLQTQQDLAPFELQLAERSARLCALEQEQAKAHAATAAVATATGGSVPDCGASCEDAMSPNSCISLLVAENCRLRFAMEQILLEVGRSPHGLAALHAPISAVAVPQPLPLPQPQPQPQPLPWGAPPTLPRPQRPCTISTTDSPMSAYNMCCSLAGSTVTTAASTPMDAMVGTTWLDGQHGCKSNAAGNEGDIHSVKCASARSSYNGSDIACQIAVTTSDEESRYHALDSPSSPPSIVLGGAGGGGGFGGSSQKQPNLDNNSQAQAGGTGEDAWRDRTALAQRQQQLQDRLQASAPQLQGSSSWCSTTTASQQ